MARVIEESNLSYEQRDQAQAEILAMEQSNLKEQEVFEQQMKSLKEEVNNNLSKHFLYSADFASSLSKMIV